MPTTLKKAAKPASHTVTFGCPQKADLALSANETLFDGTSYSMETSRLSLDPLLMQDAACSARDRSGAPTVRKDKIPGPLLDHSNFSSD